MPLVIRIQPSQPIEDLPTIALIRWRAMKTETDEVHLVGYALETARGRVSTPVRSLDPQARQAITESGRVYTLEGPPGCEPTIVQIWTGWAQVYGIRGWHDITDAFAKCLDASIPQSAFAEVLGPMPDGGRDKHLDHRDDGEKSP